jgi:hypothetical protein
MTVDQFVKARVLPEYRGHPGVPVSTNHRGHQPDEKWHTFAFSRGAEFEDKYGLLEGVGKVSKNVRMGDLKEVNKTALRYYIKQALKLDSK